MLDKPTYHQGIELVGLQDINGPPIYHIQYEVDADEEDLKSQNPVDRETSVTYTLCSRLGPEDVSSWDWKSIDDVLCTMHPRPYVELLTANSKLFKWFLHGIQHSTVFKQFYRTRNLDIHFVCDDNSSDILCSLEDIFAIQMRHAIDDKTVELDICERFDFWQCADAEKELFLRSVLTRAANLKMPETSNPVS